MAQFVNKQRTVGMALGCISLLMISLAGAESLRDPTRPPSNLGLAGNIAASSGPVLQSVLISPGRRIAIISGQTVRLGDRFGAATLVKVTEGEVVLRSGNELQTLKLFPSIEKRSMPKSVQQNSGLRK